MILLLLLFLSAATAFRSNLVLAGASTSVRDLSLSFVGGRALVSCILSPDGALVLFDEPLTVNVTVATGALSVSTAVHSDAEQLLLMWRDRNSTCHAATCNRSLDCVSLVRMQHPCSGPVAALTILSDGSAAWFAWRRDSDGVARLVYYRCSPEASATSPSVCDVPRAPLTLRSSSRAVLGLVERADGDSAPLTSALLAMPRFDVFGDAGTVAFVPLRAGVAAVRVDDGALSVAAAANLSAAGGSASLRSVRATSDGLPVLMFANASAALFLATCADAMCSANTSVGQLSRAVDVDASMSLVATRDGAVAAVWASSRRLQWLRCVGAERCGPRPLTASADSATGVDAVAAAESATRGVLALVYHELNRTSERGALRLRLCANATCERFDGDFVGAPVPTGFAYVSVVVLGAIVFCLVVCAIPACVLKRKHHLR
jgi:hypothetical protein